jgi:hypothetical protein
MERGWGQDHHRVERVAQLDPAAAQGERRKSVLGGRGAGGDGDRSARCRDGPTPTGLWSPRASCRRWTWQTERS